MITINNIKLPISDDESVLQQKIHDKLRKSNKDFEYKILKKSLDARKKEQIHYVYKLLVNVDEKSLSKKLLSDKDISVFNEEPKIPLKKGDKKLENPILVVGMGPAGLFCAYKLISYGYDVILCEQGSDVDKRAVDVKTFIKTGILNENSNVQFGEGGAGTFSDGKLTSRSKDPRGFEVLEIFHKFGAKEEILYSQKPHIGTDILTKIVKNMRLKMIENGAKVYFNTKLEDIIVENSKIRAVVLNGKKVDVSIVVFATGHSSEQIYKMLHSHDVALTQKPFAVGFRIEHLQSDINLMQYKNAADNKYLPAAEYFFTNAVEKTNKSVYTFCMCPGGFVLPSSSIKEHLVVNGMSFSKRAGKNSNSALLVNVNDKDFGANLFDGIAFQRKIERDAFRLGGGGYKAPVQKLSDFLNDNVSTELGKVSPTYPIGYTLTNLSNLYPKNLTESLKAALHSLGKVAPIFANGDAILTAPETRTSAPVRIIRDPENYNSVTLQNMYPIGEGSGYAGGIVSSAIDGLKIAEKIISIYV